MSTIDRRPDDIEELLGAYALDAVDDDERRMVDAYLATNPRARAEVDQHREVATLLAFGGADAPEGLWDRIAVAIGGQGLEAPAPGPELAKVLPARRRPKSRRWWLGAVGAAAALVAIVALTVALVTKDAGSPSVVAAYDAAKADQANHVVELQTDGTTRATAVVQPSGVAFLDARQLPALGNDRTYQLWGVLADGTPVSLGVLGPKPELTMFGVNGSMKALAITDEQAGGAVAPAQAPTIVGVI